MTNAPHKNKSYLWSASKEQFITLKALKINFHIQYFVAFQETLNSLKMEFSLKKRGKGTKMNRIKDFIEKNQQKLP